MKIWAGSAVIFAFVSISRAIVDENGDGVTGKHRIKEVSGKFKSCAELQRHGYREFGIYPIHLPTRKHKKTFVICNNTQTSSSSIVLYRNYGFENFTRGWFDYRVGFGHPNTDYWHGLDNIQRLIHQGKTGYRVLTITLKDWKGRTGHARYSNFVLGPYPGYNLHVSGFSGNIPDDMSYHNGREFYTIDRVDPYACALNQKTGWWFNYCAYALLTGVHYKGGRYQPTGGFYNGIYWKDWLGYDYSMQYVSWTLSKN